MVYIEMILSVNILTQVVVKVGLCEAIFMFFYDHTQWNWIELSISQLKK